MEEEQILSIVRQNPLCRGVTFSGGEPFAQAAEFAVLARLLKTHGYEVASYSGYTFEELQNGTQAQRALLESIAVLIDGRFALAQRSLQVAFRGSKNQRIVDVQKSLTAGKPVCITSGRWVGEYSQTNLEAYSAPTFKHKTPPTNVSGVSVFC